jgi:hypothetical protein
MSAVPVPVAPSQRFIPAVQSVTERRGVTVAVDRQPNLCRWAVHTTDTAGRDIMVTGPSRGDAANPSNRELAAQITAAVASLGVEVGQVFTSDWPTATLLRAKTALPVTDLSAPPASLVKARNGIAAVERRAVSGLVLACDASRGKGRSINGCGWVLAYSNGADPKSALDLLARITADEDVSGEDGDSVQECRRILGSARGLDIRFEWVRGHDGHPLNEIADRLAVLARRNREMGVDDITGHRMLAGVREDAKIICAAL